MGGGYISHTIKRPEAQINHINKNKRRGPSCPKAEVEFVQNFTPPDFQAKNFTLPISHLRGEEEEKWEEDTFPIP